MGPAARRERLRASLNGRVDALVVSRRVNIRYLTGFTGSAGLLHVPVGGGEPTLLTDGRYEEQARREAPDLRCRITRSTWAVAADLSRSGTTVGVEAHDLTLEGIALLEAGLTGSEEDAGSEPPTGEAAGPGVRVVPLDRPVERLRRVKDEAEVRAIAEACRLAESGLANLVASGLLRAGATERQVAAALDAEVRRLGADDRAFDTIVAFGELSAEPHHAPTSRPLRRGDLVKIDFGALLDGYHSDLTRVFTLGRAAAWQRDLHSLVLAAADSAIAAAHAGAAVAAVDARARGVIEGAGLTERFPHGLGHGLGLEVHEEPIIGPSAAGTLDSQYVVTVEPGVYLPGRGGVRVEDVVLVLPDGVRVLTEAPRDLIHL